MHPQVSIGKPTFAWADKKFIHQQRAGSPEPTSPEFVPASPSSGTLVVVTFKQRDRWSRRIGRDDRVKLMHRHVLRSLALCAHTDGGGRLVIDPTLC
jgi:hypothetical protein